MGLGLFFVSWLANNHHATHPDKAMRTITNYGRWAHETGKPPEWDGKEEEAGWDFDGSNPAAARAAGVQDW